MLKAMMKDKIEDGDVLIPTTLEATNMKAMIALLKQKGAKNVTYVIIKEHGTVEVKETVSKQIKFL